MSTQDFGKLVDEVSSKRPQFWDLVSIETLKYGWYCDTASALLEFHESDPFSAEACVMSLMPKAEGVSESYDPRYLKAVVDSWKSMGRLKRKKEGFWVSHFLYDQETLINACLSYGQYAMNPFVFQFDPEHAEEYKPLLILEPSFRGSKRMIKAGKDKYGNQRFRKSDVAVLEVAQLFPYNVKGVYVNDLHPVVWKALITHSLASLPDPKHYVK